MSKVCGSRLWGKVTILGVGVVLVCLCSVGMLSAGPEEHTVTAGNERPVADAGLSRYARMEPVTLDGTDSYDPDNSGPLSYQWQQIAGPSVTITDANTATPTVGGFTQTEAIQRCEFELVVSDAELTSPSDTVEVIIVPAMVDCPDPYGNVTTLVLKTGVFDPEKPTFVFLGGGWGAYGYGGWSPLDSFHE